MKPSLALFFAFVSVILLCGIGFAIATKLLWLTVLFIVVAFSWMGFGFSVKARLNKQSQVVKN